MSDWIQATLLGVELWRFAGLTLAIMAGWLVARIGAYFLAKTGDRLLAKERELLGATFIALGRSLVLPGIVIGIRIGLIFIEMPPRVRGMVNEGTEILTAIAIGIVLFRLVDVPSRLYRRWSGKQESKLTEMLAPIIDSSLRIAIVILVLVQVAQILSDRPISSVLAGLGIGGLALALAAQDSIKHLFGSVVIFSDRPFEVGDRVTVDTTDGVVEGVGFRSTRIRTLDGHLVTVPNGELANKSITNISKRPFIRRILNVTITYDTPPEKVDRAVAIIRELLENHEGMDEKFPPRVFFNEFNAASLNILVIYWYHPPIFFDYLAFTERFNKELLTRFNAEGIDFAFPSQTLYLAGDKKRPIQMASPIQDLKELPPQAGGE